MSTSIISSRQIAWAQSCIESQSSLFGFPRLYSTGTGCQQPFRPGKESPAPLFILRNSTTSACPDTPSARERRRTPRRVAPFAFHAPSHASTGILGQYHNLMVRVSLTGTCPPNPCMLQPNKHSCADNGKPVWTKGQTERSPCVPKLRPKA